MSRELYIYWRVRPGAEAQAVAAAAAMQSQLRLQFPHLTTRLLQRSDGSQAPTLMEIYRHAPAGIDQVLEEAIAAAAQRIAEYIAPNEGRAGQRHLEVFMAIDTSYAGSL